MVMRNKSSTSSSENSSTKRKLFPVVEIDTIICPVKGAANQTSNANMSKEIPLPALRDSPGVAKDTNKSEFMPCMCNTPTSNIVLSNKDPHCELESLKNTIKADELLCSLRHCEVSGEAERLGDEIVAQHNDSEFLNTIQSMLDQAVQTGEACARLLEEAIELLKEACDA
jgi:hypothetical protein